MSYKQYVPDTSEDWDTYWSQRSIDEELQIVKTDGLHPIFSKYVDKSGINIEAGCGLGKWVINLNNSGYCIFGLDTYHKGLKKLKTYNQELNLQTGDVNHLPLKTNSIDSYISLGVIEHFEQGPRQALKEAFRVVKPGAVAIIEVPFDSPLRIISRYLFRLKVLIKSPARLIFETLRLKKPRTKTTMKFYEYRYTKSELSKFITDTGFQLIEILPKDDLDPQRSIMLWSDFLGLRHKNGKLFQLNWLGQFTKLLLNTISPFTYSALIVAICRKP